MFLRRKGYLPVLAATCILLIGCPKSNQEFEAGRKAEALNDYDTALVHYEKALQAEPSNAEYKVRATKMRMDDGQFHLEAGEKALEKGDLQLALAEFERAQGVDPSNEAVGQEIQKTMGLIAAKSAAESSKRVNPNPTDDDELLEAPPGLKPVSREPVNLKMTNDARVVFDTIAKLAGLSVIFDPDFTSRRVTVELPNVTL
jgi:general secretion pathway protein D